MHPSRLRFLSAASLLLLARSSQALASAAQDRPFAVVEQGRVTTSSGDDMLDRAALDRYAAQHPGSYVVFSDGAAMRRLDSPSALADVKQMHDSMRPLEAEQKALAARQKPLEQQMKALGAQMRSSQPNQQSALGDRMIQLGAQMGRIGEQQGRLGEQQGALGRAFHDRMEARLADCLARRACPLL